MMTSFVKLMSALVVILVLSLAMYGHAYAISPFIYSAEGENVVQYADMYVDSDNNKTLSDIQSPQVQTQFKPLVDTYAQINNDNTYWYKLVIQPTQTSTETWLQIDPAWLDYVTMYQVMPDATYLKQVSGKYVNPAVKPFGYRFPLFKLMLHHGEATVIYLQVKTRVGQLLMVRFWSPPLFMQHESKALFGWGIYFGISFLLILASIWFERVIKDGVYGIFSIYVLCAAMLNFAITGWWYEWLYQFFGIFFFPVITLSMLWLLFFGTWFVFRFLNVAAYKPRIHFWFIRLLLVYVVLFSVLMFTSVASKAIQFHYVISLLFFFPVITFLIIKPIWQCSPVIRRIFLLIALIILIATIVSVLSLLHILPYNDYIARAPIISLIVPFLLIFYTLSKRYEMLRVEKEAAIQQMLEMTKNSEQTLKHLVEVKTKDLSEAKIKVENALYTERQAFQEQRNFIAMVSHEFRTPLAIIDATLQNLLRLKENQSLQIKLQKIARSTERLTALMSNYLSQDRLNIFLRGVQSIWFDIAIIVEEEKHLASVIFPLHPIHDDIIEESVIWGDKDVFKLVLHTLIENAAKYTPANTPITIKLHRDDAYWLLDVIDQGEGVGDEKELIFEKFYRGHTASNQVGTGLGLTLAKNLMQVQGGDLILVDRPEVGCCFRIILPYQKQHQQRRN